MLEGHLVKDFQYVWMKKCVKIRVMVFKQQFSLFKHCYQTEPCFLSLEIFIFNALQP